MGHSAAVSGGSGGGAAGVVPPGHEGCGRRCWRDLGAPPDPAGLPRFRILFVCTGNICRSPLAERLTRSALGPCPALEVASAGTHALAGEPMTGHAARVLAELGGDHAGFRARRLTAGMVEAADLVLAAAREHRAAAVAMCPAAAGRAFTIAEFGVLTGAVPAGAVDRHGDLGPRARALVAEARTRRGLVRVDQPDIGDPYGRSLRAYRAAGRLIAGALTVPFWLLTP
ncbi:hypothetical protein ABZT47_11670 [Sphaerisporangium sp. NPDC005289]|uniref:arsenate reductase/protein-tyrosine-phosphatase family protein n=1 Tax=Sphaerisporangium sp. NPDC005289 TaxID=3155247 RepID=UPI0033A490AD